MGDILFSMFGVALVGGVVKIFSVVWRGNYSGDFF